MTRGVEYRAPETFYDAESEPWLALDDDSSVDYGDQDKNFTHVSLPWASALAGAIVGSAVTAWLLVWY